jgi:hypothetical protein
VTKEIEDLAAKGRRVRADAAAKAEQAATAEATRERAEERAKDHKRLWQSVSLFGMRGREIGEWYFVILAMVFSGAGVGYLFSLFHFTWGNILIGKRDPSPIPIAGPIVAGLVLAWVIYQTIVPLPRERAWVKSLPFTVRGYELALSSYRGDNESNLELEFVWTGAPPEQQMLLDLLVVDGVTWTGKTSLRVARAGIRSSDSDHNREVRTWWRRLVEERLLALHRSHPFTMVTLLNERARKLRNPHAIEIPA